MLEHELALAALKILATGGGHVLGLPLELDSAVAAVAPLDGDESLARALLDDQARLAELECARVCNSTYVAASQGAVRIYDVITLM